MTSSATKIQSRIAVASFASGVGIACICLFVIPPIGEIHSTAISIVSELLVLAGALLGVKSAYDHKLMKFEASIEERIKRAQNGENQ